MAPSSRSPSCTPSPVVCALVPSLPRETAEEPGSGDVDVAGPPESLPPPRPLPSLTPTAATALLALFSSMMSRTLWSSLACRRALLPGARHGNVWVFDSASNWRNWWGMAELVAGLHTLPAVCGLLRLRPTGRIEGAADAGRAGMREEEARLEALIRAKSASAAGRAVGNIWRGSRGEGGWRGRRGGVISWSERRRPTRHQREEGGHAWLQVLRDRKWVEMCVDWDEFTTRVAGHAGLTC